MLTKPILEKSITIKFTTQFQLHLKNLMNIRKLLENLTTTTNPIQHPIV